MDFDTALNHLRQTFGHLHPNTTDEEFLQEFDFEAPEDHSDDETTIQAIRTTQARA